MATETIAVQEQLTKRVVSSGNGGAVWVPRSWLGEEIIVIRPEKPDLDIKERIIKLLTPYLQDITAIFLYGSYARNEQEADSDIDVLVIAKEKFNVKKHERMDIKVIELNKLKETLEKNPILYLSILQEAKPIINSSLLEELNDIKVDYKNFKWFIETTIDNIKSDRELMELDKIDGEYITSYGAIYSIILRLRGIFLIKSLMSRKNYSNKLFKKWLLGHGVSASDYKTAYKIYKSIRDGKKAGEKIKIIASEMLLNVLIKEIDELKVKIYGK